MSLEFPQTTLNTVKRLSERGHYDAATIYPIIDEALICHVGFVVDHQPVIIPTLHVRDGDRILLHGSQASRMLRHLEAGGEACIAITLVDGIVMARTVFNHSINYRSVAIFGRGQKIERPDQYRVLERFMERLIPGRWNETRLPNREELLQTAIVALTVESASAKIRTGPPHDADEDLEFAVWAGVLPIRQVFGSPVADPHLKPETEVPAYIRNYRRG